MIKKHYGKLILLLLLSINFHATAQDFKSLERKLVDNYLTMLHSEAQLRVDSLGPLLKKRMLYVLEMQNSFSYAFDSLKLFITIASSPDKKLRTFSWDEHTGKSNHTMVAFMQFADRNGTVHTNAMSGNDVLYYEWHQLKVNNEMTYLSFGYGSYGTSNHFKRVNAFRISEHGLKWVTGLFNWSAEFGDAIFIIAPKKKKIYLHYDDRKNVLVFRQFIQKDFNNIRFKKGKIIHLTLQDGFFQLR